MNSLGKRTNRLGMDQTDLSLLMRRYGIGLVLIAMCIFLMIATPNFTKATNLLSILNSVAVNGCSCRQTSSTAHRRLVAPAGPVRGRWGNRRWAGGPPACLGPHYNKRGRPWSARGVRGSLCPYSKSFLVVLCVWCCRNRKAFLASSYQNQPYHAKRACRYRRQFTG